MSAMTPPRPRTIDDERHDQNIRKFTDIDTRIGANTLLTQQALTESQSNRHQLKGLNQSLLAMLKLYEDDKKERKEERLAATQALDKQADDIKKLQQRYTWALGFIAALSFVFHELGDLIAPLVRHLLQ
jgi:hypothetical protein